ncbi:HNH endonuclease [Bacillus sp. AG4(2022)]|uniref:HNH endonuclease n=1 Tax=Bacillus sp. AG4(2022) TaxID=2962594 RepID=UPI0028827425|nr:HNH endonuclease [Bacillus sp. AG4(2022)]MDT0160659.1 HNH endonuclease [Bacillus sp. AG4(2022)]
MSLIGSALSEVSKASTEVTKEVPNIESPNDLPTSNTEEVEAPSDSGESRYIICRNESLEGDRHPITGIEFEKKEIELPDGTRIEGVFPKFDSLFDAKLDESQYEESDAKQFKEANNQLKNAIENDPKVREQFSDQQIEQIEAGDTPEGYVWHHSEETGTLQLVDSTIHAQTGHTGGRSIWGGGNESR